MNLSERAEQLADAIGVSTWGIPRNRAIEKILAFAADSANLARGVAIEQAAQFVEKTVPYQQGIGSISVTMGKYIRSLDPDAAQALVHHNATVFQDTLDDLKHDGSELVVGGKEPVRIFSEASLAAHDAEKMQEGKDWEFRHHHDPDHECCVNCQLKRISHDAEIERRARLDGKIEQHEKDCGLCQILIKSNSQQRLTDCYSRRDLEAERVSLSAPATHQNIAIPPHCYRHNEDMILAFYDRPGSPPGNGWSCQSCAKEPYTPTLTFGDGDYSCAICGMGMEQPCEHWKELLEIAATVKKSGK